MSPVPHNVRLVTPRQAHITLAQRGIVAVSLFSPRLSPTATRALAKPPIRRRQFVAPGDLGALPPRQILSANSSLPSPRAGSSLLRGG